MSAPNDNVEPLMTLERLAVRASQAMVEYEAGLAAEIGGRQRAIRAVVAYGRALLEGREGRSNQAFSVWVHENKLDVGKPWSEQQERTAAMLIAKSVQGKITLDTFAACPNTHPTNIMKWFRKMYPSADQKPKPAKKVKRRSSLTKHSTLSRRWRRRVQRSRQARSRERPVCKRPR